MVLVDMIGQMEVITLESGFKTNYRDKANIYGLMGEDIKVHIY